MSQQRRGLGGGVLVGMIWLILLLVSTVPGVAGEVSATAWALLPPALAIGLTFLTRNVYLSVLTAIFAGCLLIEADGPGTAFLRMWDTHLVRAVVPADGGTAHAKIILFTFLMGAFVELTRLTGGSQRLVQALGRLCRTRRSGQSAMAGAGLGLFFDDYANSLLLGTSFRELADQLRISRAKLAFLIDATAAPVAGLALISTWVGVELSYFADALKATGYEGPVYALFLQTIPYRLYPLCMLGFVFFVARQGRDFGPMWQVEQRMQRLSGRDSQKSQQKWTLGGSRQAGAKNSNRGLLMLDALPLVSLVVFLLVGLVWSGWTGMSPEMQAAGWSIPRLLDACDPNDAMLWAAAGSFLLAGGIASVWHRHTWAEMNQAMLTGMESMLPATLIFVLAWALSTLCEPEQLNVAGYLIHLLGDQLLPAWLPTLSFVLCGLISFATGSSWATMGIMFPMLIPLAAASLTAAGMSADPQVPLMAAVTGGILAGAIWGDHCSPIADTTVLTSAATQCDHFEHVQTQMPYAVTVGAICILFGTLPLGWGVSVWVVLPLCFIGAWLSVRLFGKPIVESTAAPEGETEILSRRESGADEAGDRIEG